MILDLILTKVAIKEISLTWCTMEILLKAALTVFLSTTYMQSVQCEPICADKLESIRCQTFEERQYCDKDSFFYSFMEKNCAKSCRFCDQGSNDAYEAMCADDSKYGSSCVGWKEKGLCYKTSPFYSFMKTYCPKTCSFCSNAMHNKTLSMSYSSCVDFDQYASYCSGWKDQSFCEASSPYYSFMQQYCPKTCGFCSTGGTLACGKSSKTPSRVVGGTEASPHSWPWQVGLQYEDLFFCGGTLIDDQWIVTASHCTLGKEVSLLKVVLGDHNRFNNDGTEQQFNAIKIVMHPDYNLHNQDNDIALVKLESKVSMSSDILSACLPTSIQDASLQQDCYLTGWGKTDVRGDHAESLQEVKLPVVTNEVCNTHNAPAGKTVITDNMICAGYGYETRQSGCRGDSGGPLVCFYEDKWTLRGVVSWGSSLCLGHEKYTVFARVSRYISWISETIKSE